MEDEQLRSQPGGDMEYRVLGQVEASRDGRPVALGSFRRRSLLAFLLMHGNEVISTDRLIDELWGDNAGLERQNALWVHVSNLRSALEPERERRSEGTLLLTRSPGYLLQVRPDEVDAGRFEHLLEEGRLLIDSDPAAASVVIGEALALWRGRPYEDFAYESFTQAEIPGSRSCVWRPSSCASTPIFAEGWPPSWSASSRAWLASIRCASDSPPCSCSRCTDQSGAPTP